MERLQVPEALQGVAKRIGALSSEVSERTPLPSGGAAHQPTAAAMQRGHAGVQAAATTMAMRLQDTGVSIAAVESLVNANDIDAAEKLSRVS